MILKELKKVLSNRVNIIATNEKTDERRLMDSVNNNPWDEYQVTYIYGIEKHYNSDVLVVDLKAVEKE